MSEANKTTELNQRSLDLTDAELAMVDKFSVLLPMNELPEIVIANQKNATGATVKSEQGIPREAIIPFQIHSDSPENSEARTKTTGNAHPADLSDSQNTPEPPKSKNSQPGIQPNEPELAPTVEFPKDELSISQQADEFDDDHDVGPQDAAEAEFDVGEMGKYHERVESIAQSIEANLDTNQSSIFALVSPEHTADQDLIFNSLLMSMASRNPEYKLIGVQCTDPLQETNSYSVGLGHVLSEEYMLEDVVIPTSSDNLDYLAFTEGSLSNSSYKNRIRRTLDELKKHYDLVFVNAGKATSPETLALCEAADSFYLLVRLEKAEQGPVVNAVDTLRKKGAKLAGCILSGYQREAS